MEIKSFVNEISYRLKNDFENNHLQKAWWILESITNKAQSELILNDKFQITEYQLSLVNDWIDKHVNHYIPLQYLIGYVPFIDLKIFVEQPILIPRPETEEWCSELIILLKNLSNKNINILDVGTGSGCIAIAIAKSLPQAKVVAIDIEPKALNLSKKNAKYNKIKNIEIVKSDLFDSDFLRTLKFDLIVSNPPYIDENLFHQLDNSVKKWEDQKALTCRDSGLEIIKKIISQSSNYLKINEEFKLKNIPQLVIEIDEMQAIPVETIMQNNGFKNVNIKKDLQKKDRVVFGGR